MELRRRINKRECYKGNFEKMIKHSPRFQPWETYDDFA